MASSSAQELSQESDKLKGSYFTHLLLTALRGAADADGDGRVSLDEAYHYAYRRTLAATARTQVGSQHVTLEMDLAGQGDVPVTYPAQARSHLELPAALDEPAAPRVHGRHVRSDRAHERQDPALQARARGRSRDADRSRRVRSRERGRHRQGARW